MSLINEISKTITKNILGDLSQDLKTNLIHDLTIKLSEEFEIEEKDLNDALNSFFDENLSKYLEKYTDENLGKMKLRKTKKRSNSKGKQSSFFLYCKSLQPKLKEQGLSQIEIAKEAGKRWRELSDNDKSEWKEKADEINKENGLYTQPKEKQPKKTTKKKTEAEKPQKKATKTKASTSKKASKKASKKNSVKIELDADTMKFHIADTNFIVKSAQEKNIVIGKIHNGKCYQLDENEKSQVEKDGLIVENDPEFYQDDNPDESEFPDKDDQNDPDYSEDQNDSEYQDE